MKLALFAFFFVRVCACVRQGTGSSFCAHDSVEGFCSAAVRVVLLLLGLLRRCLCEGCGAMLPAVSSTHWLSISGLSF